MTAHQPDIYIEAHKDHARLVLNRPAKKNAITLAMWDAIPQLLEEALEMCGVRALVVTGNGRAFAAGADIAEFETVYATPQAAMANQARMQTAMNALENFPLPTLAMIEGACVGGGCGLALSCDLRFAADDARFGITPAKLGLVYGIADTRRLVQAVGLSAAKDILFSGRLLDAQEAQRLRLIDHICAPQDLGDHVAAYIAGLARASSFSARATKQILAQLRDGTVYDNDQSRALFASAFSGSDFREGFAAFTQKRAPNFDQE
ncbi:MAG: enoyl-CoA hydratase/isomerase family protein [Caulobacterales bacterium]|jgi:enoyl-CoA hydratase/carnithine racemase